MNLPVTVSISLKALRKFQLRICLSQRTALSGWHFLHCPGLWHSVLLLEPVPAGVHSRSRRVRGGGAHRHSLEVGLGYLKRSSHLPAILSSNLLAVANFMPCDPGNAPVPRSVTQGLNCFFSPSRSPAAPAAELKLNKKLLCKSILAAPGRVSD